MLKPIVRQTQPAMEKAAAANHHHPAGFTLMEDPSGHL